MTPKKMPNFTLISSSAEEVATLEALHAEGGLGLFYETLVAAWYLRTVQAGDTVIDVGANEGTHFFPLANRVGRAGMLNGFEPIPKLANALKVRAKAAGLSHTSIFEIAIGLKAGTADFYCFRERMAMSGLKRRLTDFSNEEAGLQVISVKTDTLDNMLGSLFPSFIKLDIEGGEFHALQGATKTLKRARPSIAFEYGGQPTGSVYQYDHDGFFDFFASRDYALFTVTGVPYHRNLWGRYAGCWELLALPIEKADLIKAQRQEAESLLQRLDAGGLYDRDTVNACWNDLLGRYGISDTEPASNQALPSRKTQKPPRFVRRLRKWWRMRTEQGDR